MESIGSILGAVALLAGHCLAAEGLTLSARLEFFGVPSVPIQISPCRRPFAKEPDLKGHNLARFVIPVLAGTRQLGLLLDQDEERLYVDLNADGDLTNDPNNRIRVSSMQVGARGRGYNLYDLKIPIGRLAGLDEDLVYRFQLMVWFCGRRGYRQAWLWSAYRVEADVDGKRIILDFFDADLDGHIDTFSPTGTFRSTSYSAGSTRPYAIPRQVFVAGSTYRLDMADFPTVRLLPYDGPLGRLTLHQGSVTGVALVDANQTFLWLDPCETTFSVPAGDYQVTFVGLGGGTRDGTRHIPAQGYQGTRVLVREGQDAELRLGTPLRHHVELRRAGRVLLLEYKLVGQGGEVYDLRRLFDTPPRPTFVVYKGQKAIVSEKFEFG
ncbi:MAG: hypothetical protein QHH07_11045 [Sedimentisphaerales bacterium]|nr:hypothetical protein [Sedimentisphaerales bacterium]